MRRSKREFGTFSFVLLCPRAWIGIDRVILVRRARARSIMVYKASVYSRPNLIRFLFFNKICTPLFMYSIRNETQRLVSQDSKICNINQTNLSSGKAFLFLFSSAFPPFRVNNSVDAAVDFFLPRQADRRTLSSLRRV